MARLYYDIFETRVGWLGFLFSSGGLKRSTLPQCSPDRCVIDLAEDFEEAELCEGGFESLRGDVVRYLNGESVSFHEVRIDVRDASQFLREAWMACRAIPWGETRSYKWIAVQTGKPLAYRAAGQAMANNRLPIIIPCHRVVASHGGLGGYGRGTALLGLKEWLLDLESARNL